MTRSTLRPSPEVRLPATTAHDAASTRLLMCAPTGYGLKYEINPWMHLANAPDLEKAARQWENLYRVLTEEVGATVELIPQAADAPDMVFTANAGLVRGSTALLSSFRHPERQVEEPRFRDWFETHGYTVVTNPDDSRFEGEGDALFAGDRLLAGYLKRSDIQAHRWISETLEVPVLSLELTDDRWYHLDTCLFPLDGRTIACYPAAFDRYAISVLESDFEIIRVTEREALRFACNAVRVGKHIVLPSGCPILSRSLEARGYQAHAVELSEFLKAGGAAKCLTLYLNGNP